MATQTLLQRIKAQVGSINWVEIYTLLLILFGIPLLVMFWLDGLAALTAFVVINIVVGLLTLRGRQ